MRTLLPYSLASSAAQSHRHMGRVVTATIRNPADLLCGVFLRSAPSLVATISRMLREPLKPFTDDQRRDMLIGIAHPKVAAEKLGIPVSRVLARRQELGLPSVEEQFAKPTGRQPN